MSTNSDLANIREPIECAGGWSDKLPVTLDLTLPYVLSFVIAFLVAGVATAGLLWPGSVYRSEETLLSFLPVDLFHLVIGLPTLLGSMALARRGPGEAHGRRRLNGRDFRCKEKENDWTSCFKQT